jgi:hypothetical protein
MRDVFVSFDLPSFAQQPVREADLRHLAGLLRSAFAGRGFGVDDLFGSADDVWGFSIDCRREYISIGLSPPSKTTDARWLAHIQSFELGWLKSTRSKRAAELKRVEWALHDVLVGVGARGLKWSLPAGGFFRPRINQSTP